jgi:hypothetical protein
MPLPLLLSLVFLITTARAKGDKNEIHLGGDACGRGTLNGPEKYNWVWFYKTHECNRVDSELRLTEVIVWRGCSCRFYW